MKLKLKMLAVAAAMASMAGAAHADLTAPGSANGSLALVAFNTVTGSYYMRDTGFLLNSFLPTGVTTLSGDGSVAGDKTPAAGLLLDKTNTASFADASFSGWLAGQTFADVKWFVNAVDAVGTTTATNVKRFITSSANADEFATNGNLDGFIANAGAGSLTTQFGTGGLSVTGSGAPTAWGTNFTLGADGLAAVDQSVSLFYFSRTVGTGSTTLAANKTQFGNATGFATVTLASSGDFTYNLAGEAPAAVPVPAAAWLLGSGLVGMGGFMRRRKAAAAAQA
ncbi:MAG: VPLPA-CTERM sorting domain-containing protein [Pseudomonadota bacterium]